MNYEKITGVFAPVPTPFNEDESLDLKSWEKNVEAWSASPLDGIVIAGSNGELPFLEMDERAALTRSAAKVCRGRKYLMAGAHFPSERRTIEAAIVLAEAGANGILLLPPHYFKGNDEAILKYFLNVADRSPVPVFLYNMPKNTGVDLSVEIICRAAEHPNIKGIKDTSGDMSKLGYVASGTPKDFSLFGGTGNWFLAALSMGACGGTMAVSILFPGACRALFDSFNAGDGLKAAEIQRRLLPVSDAITRRFGIPGLKYALSRHGMIGGPCRRPLQPLSDDARTAIDRAMDCPELSKYEKWR